MSKEESFIDIHNLELSDTNYENVQLLEQSLKAENKILSVREVNKATLFYIVQSTYKHENDYIRIGKMRNSFFVKNGAINIPVTELDVLKEMIEESKSHLEGEN